MLHGTLDIHFLVFIDITQQPVCFPTSYLYNVPINPFRVLAHIDSICHYCFGYILFPVSYKVATPIVANQIETFTTVS